MKQFKKRVLFIILSWVMVGCSPSETLPDDNEVTDQQVVQSTKAADYEMLVPFVPSPVRQIRTIGAREIDSHEIGRQLLENSKEHFSVNNYFISEGQLIDESRYIDLLQFKSEDNPDGIMVKYTEGLDIDGVTLVNPIFMSDIFELNFHQKNKENSIDGVSLAIVLKRYQVLDETTGIMHALSDDALFNIGQTLGLQLSAYVRSLENMSDVPLYIGLYVQSSDIDKLPGNYLPGYFIGDAYSASSSMTFSRSTEGWLLLSDANAQSMIPEIVSQFDLLKRKIILFTGDESVGVVGKVFIDNNSLESIQVDLNVPSKTYLETFGLGQYIAQEIEGLSNFDITVKVKLDVYSKTRAVVIKNPGEKVMLEVFD